MNEIARHIEILLLDNDLVMVPGLGGFVAHSVEASYDEADGLYLPPKRVLGFNSQLQANDSLLAQSYIEVYDISYPEALRRIEADVNLLVERLDQGSICDLAGLGSLSKDAEGHLLFEPCEAGILTPELYGLGHVEVRAAANTRVGAPPVGATHCGRPEPISANVGAPHEEPVQPATDSDEPEEQTDDGYIRIKVAWIRNAVAAAAAIVAFFLIAPPVANSVDMGVQMGSFGFTPTTEAASPHTSPAPSRGSSPEEPAPAAEPVPADTQVGAPHEEPASAAEFAPAPQEEAYCIVLASQVPKKNADLFVDILHEAGHDQAYTFIRRKVVRVVYGSYPSETDAYNDLRKLRGQKHFEQAWVMKK